MALKECKTVSLLTEMIERECHYMLIALSLSLRSYSDAIGGNDDGWQLLLLA